MTESAKPGGRWRKYTRRAFLITGVTVLGGAAVGLGFLSRFGKGIPEDFADGGSAGAVALNAWVRIEPDGTIELAIPRAEMGQGVGTALAMLIAEELEVSLERVVLEHPAAHGVYANYALMLEDSGLFHKEGNPLRWVLSKVAAGIPFIVTGGSSSVVDGWKSMRQVGAAARHMLVEAAATRWGGSPESCEVELGEIIHPDGNARLDFAEVAAAAARLEPPSSPKLKPQTGFRLVGKSQARLDIPEKVTGRARFGMDVQMEEMLHGAVMHCPVAGGRITSFDTKAIAGLRGIEGVHAVTGGVAVVANNSWRAFKAVEALPITVEGGEQETFSTTRFSKILQQSLRQEPTHVFESQGDVPAGLESAQRRLDAEYAVPYLAHACLEPMNATVRLNHDGSVDVWAPTQSPTIATWAASEGAGVDTDQVRVHVTYLGGGFGRRAEKDFVLQAAELARHYPGRPVKLTWSREQDLKHGTYRPMARARFRAGLDVSGALVAWDSHLASRSTEFEYGERTLPFGGGDGSNTFMNAAGAFNQPYDLSACRVAHHWLRAPVPVGFWRSVGHSQNAFFFESFMDEVAVAAKTDPLQFRLQLLRDSPRHRAVLEAVARLSGWSDTAQLGRGIALHESFGSIVAEVAEVEIVAGAVRVKQVWVAADTGVVVNPDTVRAQLESGIIYGLSAALYGGITLEDGRVQQSNYPDYEMVRLRDAPKIEGVLVPSGDRPGGVGEISTPPIAPAVANAIFAATGERIRELPLRRSSP